MPVQVETLEPSNLYTGERLSIGGTASFLYGLYAGYPGPGTIWAGFQYHGFPPGGLLVEQDDYLYRGGVQFDLSKLQSAMGHDFWFISAKLEFWQQEPRDPRYPDMSPFDRSSTLIFTASGDWAGGVLDNYLIPTTGKDEDYVNTVPPYAPPEGGGLYGLMSVDVYYQVFDWLRGAQPQLRLLFRGHG